MNILLEIQNIKSIQKTHLVLKDGLNILVGPNGSGKTCLLFSLKFLRDLISYGAAQTVARGG
ncbi:MAG: ATP-binding protein, partial [Cyanobacteria bacterium J06659_2]